MPCSQLACEELNTRRAGALALSEYASCIDIISRQIIINRSVYIFNRTN
jgi:hypothetical protein